MKFILFCNSNKPFDTQANFEVRWQISCYQAVNANLFVASFFRFECFAAVGEDVGKSRTVFLRDQIKLLWSYELYHSAFVAFE